MKFALVLLMSFGLVACSSSSGDGGSSGSSGGSSGSSGDGVNYNPATGGVTGALTGTFTGSKFALFTNTGGVTGLTTMKIYAAGGATDASDLTGGLVLSAPAGVTTQQVVQNWGWTVLPDGNADYTQASPNVCGGFAISASNGNYTYTAPNDCNGHTQEAHGTLNVHLGTLTRGPQSSVLFAPSYNVTGKITAHLDPQSGTGDGVDLTLNFTSP